MPDQKLTELTEDTTPTTDDIIVTVHDVGGTPVNRKVTLANLLASLGIQIEPAEGGFADGDKTKLDNISQVANPPADAIAFFDLSAGEMVYFTGMTGLSISGTTLTADLRSVAGLTGTPTAAQLRTAINVEDGATADQTGSEIVSAIDAELGGSTWQNGAGGGGDLLAANNLSDLADAGAARGNLGLGTAATTAASAYATAAQGDVAQTEVVTVCLYEAGEDVATGDKAGNQVLRIPAKLNGYNLTNAEAYVDGAGSGGDTQVQVHNITDTADMLSAVLNIASGGTDATGGTIDGTNDDVATGDKIRFDVDAVSTTAPQGLWVELTFEAP